MTLETRSFTGDYTTEGNRLTGYAAVWDSPTQINENGRSFTEVIRSGAFAKAIASRGSVIATFNHNPDALLARTDNGTLRLMEDAHGLRFELDLPDTQLGRDIKTLTSTGTLRGASFTFNVRAGGEKWNGNTRELRDVFLYELGPVSTPAYQATSLGLRADMELKKMRLQLAEKMM